MKKTTSGFTIVELLIVIVVIAILAAISIVAYNGIQERARVSEVSSALSQAKKKIGVWQVDNPETTPSDLATAGVTSSGNVSYQYKPGTNGTYCITATSGPTSYKITNDTAPTSGGCAGHGVGGQAAITNLAVNPSVEVNAANLQNPFGGGSPNNTLSRDTSSAYSGSASARFGRATGYSDSRMARYLISNSPTGQYNYSAWVRVNDTAIGTVSMSFEFCGSTGSTNSNPNNTAGVIGEWRRLSGVFTITAAGNVCINFLGGGNQVGSINIDAIMITSGSGLYNFADGTSTNWDWNGAVHNSTSTGPAS